MKYPIFATDAPKPKNKSSQVVALIYAVVLVVIVLCQLFTFDQFIKILGNQMLASLIIIIEVFSLPFLLRMKVSPLMRIVSMVFGWLVALMWLTLSLSLIIVNSPFQNIGFLGSVVKNVPIWVVAVTSAGFVVMSAWASWGMWPLKRHNRG